MTLVNKIDSNITGLTIAEELSVKVLPATPVWIPLEPNAYNDFGSDITTVARNPINQDRQRKKGVVVDLDASGGFDMDFTQTNHQDVMQGYFFADFRPKGEAKNPIGIATLLFAATAAGGLMTRSGTPALDLTTQFAIGDLVFVAGYTDPANNGLFRVGTVTSTVLTLTTADGASADPGLADEGPIGTVSIVQVGIEGVAGDIDVDMTGSRPALTSTTLDFTTMGLSVGEFIFIGGDAADNAFTNAVNNGRARVRSIAAARLEFDKTESTMVTEASTTENIHLYTGRVLKNETGTLIKRRTYQLERQLGAPDDALPSEIQSEYLIGSVPSELQLTMASADKFVTALSFISADNESRTGAVGVKSGTRPALVETDAFNTSSDFSRIKLAVHSESDANPVALFAFATEMDVTINNNISQNKALGVLGAFDTTAGNFQVGGSITAYFADVASVAAVRDNADVTLDMHLAKNNSGVAIDIPLLTLGDGRLNVTQDDPITLPLTNEAVTGAKIDPAMNHTLMIVFYDFLPTAAE